MKKILSLIFIFIFCFSLVGCKKDQKNGLKNPDTLVVGMECNYPPYNWTEHTKTETNVLIKNELNSYAEGYDVGIAKKIANGLNVKLEIVRLEWNLLIPSLNEGKIDCIIAGMSPTALRQKQIDFTENYYTSSHVVLLEKESKYKDAKILNEFAGAKVAGQKNTLYSELVRQLVNHGAVQGENLNSMPELIDKILKHEIDATIVEEPVAKGLCEANPTLTYIKPIDKFILNKEDIMVSIGVRKNFTLTDKINEILSFITTDERAMIMENAVRNQK